MTLKNTILGILWGSLIGSYKSGDIINRKQLLEYMRNTMKNGKFNHIEYCNNLKKIVDNQLSVDKILMQVTNHKLCEINPTKAAEDINRKLMVIDGKKFTPTNAALIRAIPASLFEDWIDGSILATMCTHMNTRCIASGLMISSILREKILGLEIHLDTILPETLDLIYESKQMDEKEFKKLVKYSLEAHLIDIKKMKKPENYVYISLIFCLRSLSYFLNNNLTFEEGIEAAIKYDVDIETNLPLIGALFGCEVGYDNLPKELLLKIPESKKIEELFQNWIEKFLDSIPQNSIPQNSDPSKKLEK